MFKERIKIMVS